MTNNLHERYPECPILAVRDNGAVPLDTCRVSLQHPSWILYDC